MEIPVNDKIVILNSEIIIFYFKHFHINEKEIKILSSHAYVDVMFKIDHSFECIACILKKDYQVYYQYNKKFYSEKQMLSIVRLKAFL